MADASSSGHLGAIIVFGSRQRSEQHRFEQHREGGTIDGRRWDETKGHRDRGESVSACVRDQRAALFHTYHVRWEEVAVAFDSVVENDDIGESGGETGGRAAFKAQAAPKAKLSPEHMEVGPTKFGGRFPRKY